jgi:hypothetical protein
MSPRSILSEIGGFERNPAIYFFRPVAKIAITTLCFNNIVAFTLILG